jgi:hypothetical protein
MYFYTLNTVLIEFQVIKLITHIKMKRKLLLISINSLKMKHKIMGYYMEKITMFWYEWKISKI